MAQNGVVTVEVGELEPDVGGRLVKCDRQVWVTGVGDRCGWWD